MIASLFEQFELLLGPHVEIDRADKTNLNSERTMCSRAVNANQDGVVDGGPVGVNGLAVEALSVGFNFSYSREHTRRIGISHFKFN